MKRVSRWKPMEPACFGQAMDGCDTIIAGCQWYPECKQKTVSGKVTA